MKNSNQNQVTLKVADFEKAVGWYAQFFNKQPIYIDPVWAIFESGTERVCIENALLVGQIDMASEYIDRKPDLQAHIQGLKDKAVPLVLDLESEAHDEIVFDSQGNEVTIQMVPITIH